VTRTLRLAIQYDGTRYHGWQLQPGLPTIQGEIERALGRILGEPPSLAGSGRTDAGVHARGQVASLKTSCGRGADVILRAANALLPWDIRVLEIAEAPEDFHARFSAVGKEYRYQIWTGPVVPPFLYPFAAHCRARLDAAGFSEAASLLLGTHDFTAFASAGGADVDPVRTVMASDLLRDGDLWVYRIRAGGFLHHMVRNIAGTLLEIGRGRWDPARVVEILASRDRTRAGPALPPRGLFLETVFY